jgi:hypothetical protein
MKLVELLADKIAQWPEGADYAVQDYDGCFKFGAGKNQRYPGSDGIWIREEEIEHETYNGFCSSEKTTDYRTSIVTREMWQAERDRQKGGEWKRHRAGRKQPVADRTKIEVKFRDGEIHTVMSDRVDWIHYGHGSDLMQYRVISQPQAEEVEVRLFNHEVSMNSQQGEIIHGPVKMGDTIIAPAHPKWSESVHAPTIEALENMAAEWRTDQNSGPLAWRDTIIHCQAIIEDCEREIQRNENLLALEGFALIPAMTPVAGFSDVDMGDWRNWKAGDVLKCIESNCDNVYTVGKLYKVEEVTRHYARVSDDCGPGSYCSIDNTEDVRFDLSR